MHLGPKSLNVSALSLSITAESKYIPFNKAPQKPSNEKEINLTLENNPKRGFVTKRSLHFKNQTVRSQHHAQEPRRWSSEHMWRLSAHLGPFHANVTCCLSITAKRIQRARYTCGMQRFSFIQVHTNGHQVMSEGLQASEPAGTLQSLKN